MALLCFLYTQQARSQLDTMHHQLDQSRATIKNMETTTKENITLKEKSNGYKSDTISDGETKAKGTLCIY